MADPNLPCSADRECETRLRRALEASGSRYTKQRAAVYSFLRAADTHPSAEEVYRYVQRVVPHISLATVYKALEALVGAGLALKIGDGDGPARYDGRTQAHYHCRCLKTGEVCDAPATYDPALLEKLDPNLVATLRSQGFEVTNYRLELVGYRLPQV